MTDVRFRFSKVGDARYISHLDLTRCFSRAIRTGGIPAWHTQGFNPHVYLHFATALSLGQESICEALDIRLTGDYDYYLAERMNRCLPGGIEIYDVTRPVLPAAQIAYAHYLVDFYPGEGTQSLTQELRRYLGQQEIPVMKKNKKGQNVSLDIKPLIANHKVVERDGHCRLDLVLVHGREKSLNPSLLIQDLYRGRQEMNGVSNICRIRLLTESLKSFE